MALSGGAVMGKIRCPHCGSGPVTIRGSRWECGWCGDCGTLGSLRPAERAKLGQSGRLTAEISVTVRDGTEDQEKSGN